MNAEFELQVQAYLDGELTPAEARRVADRIAGDREAQALLSELTATRRWLRPNEPSVSVPASREFYWSQIERGIERLEPARERAGRELNWRNWLRYLVPAAGVALAVGLGVLWLKQGPTIPPDDPLHYLAETENLSEHNTSFTFRSQRENMFVVWISNKEPQPSAETDATDEVYQ
jgi:hypothetical protein